LRNALPSAKPDPRVREPLRDLNHEFFPNMLDAEPSEPLTVLNRIFFSERLEDDPSIMLSPILRAFTSELAKPWLPENVLNNDR